MRLHKSTLERGLLLAIVGICQVQLIAAEGGVHLDQHPSVVLSNAHVNMKVYLADTRIFSPLL